jgi:hypothetical protein
VIVDTSARIADFKEKSDDGRAAMIDWFEDEMCGDRSDFACRCVSDRIDWGIDSADDYRDFVVHLLRGDPIAEEAVAKADRRCEGLTSDAIMQGLDRTTGTTVRELVARMKTIDSRLKGERIEERVDEISCDEWSETLPRVQRAVAREIVRSAPWYSTNSRDSARDVIRQVDLGCADQPEASANGWLAAEIVLAISGPEALP